MFQRRSIHTMSGAGRLGCSCHHRCTMSSRWRIGLLNPYGPRLGPFEQQMDRPPTRSWRCHPRRVHQSTRLPALVSRDRAQPWRDSSSRDD